MKGNRPRVSLVAAGALAVLLLGARAGARESEPEPRAEAGSTRLVFILGDDDVLHAPSETRPPSPATSIGD